MVGCAAERCGGTIANPLIAIAIKRSFFIDFPFYHKIGCRRLRGSQIKGVLAFVTWNRSEVFAGGGRCETAATLTDYAARDFREHRRTNQEKIVDFH